MSLSKPAKGNFYLTPHQSIFVQKNNTCNIFCFDSVQFRKPPVSCVWGIELNSFLRRRNLAVGPPCGKPEQCLHQPNIKMARIPPSAPDLF